MRLFGRLASNQNSLAENVQLLFPYSLKQTRKARAWFRSVVLCLWFCSTNVPNDAVRWA
jgi:hypothetical protein